MKKIVYIVLFTFLGYKLAYILHVILEVSAINLLTARNGSFGMPWETWTMVHAIGSAILYILGIWFGYTQGKKWWRIIYVEKRFAQRRRFWQ